MATESVLVIGSLSSPDERVMPDSRRKWPEHARVFRNWEAPLHSFSQFIHTALHLSRKSTQILFISGQHGHYISSLLQTGQISCSGNDCSDIDMTIEQIIETICKQNTLSEYEKGLAHDLNDLYASMHFHSQSLFDIILQDTLFWVAMQLMQSH